MRKISEYDERQLRLMYESLISFEKKQIGLSSLVGTLEFLLNALESINPKWEEKFLTEVTTLESINAIEIIKYSGEETPEIKKEEKDFLIKNAILNIKNLIKYELTKDDPLENIV